MAPQFALFSERGVCVFLAVKLRIGEPALKYFIMYPRPAAFWHCGELVKIFKLGSECLASNSDLDYSFNLIYTASHLT